MRARKPRKRRAGPAGVAAVLLLVPLVSLAEPSSARRGELLHLLKQDCGSCHGMTLKGGLGPALLPETLAGKPPEMLIATILDGRPGTAMPPWRPVLSREEAAWLVDVLLEGVPREEQANQ